MEERIMISAFIPHRFDGAIAQEVFDGAITQEVLDGVITQEVADTDVTQATDVFESDLTLPSKRTLHAPKAEAGYLKTARRIFLEGTSFSAPVDAVVSGARTIEEWCDCLRQLRLEYGVHAHRHGDNP
jgi:hypothetical protein